MEIKNKDWVDKKFIRINHRAIEKGLFKIKPTTLKVLLTRLLLANDKGECDFSSYWISRCTSLSFGTVLKAEKELEKLDWFVFSRQKKGDKKRRDKNGRWMKNNCKIGSNLPDFLRGVFREEDRSQNLTTDIEPTDNKNSVTEKLATNSLNVDNSLVVSSTQQLFEELFFPLREGRDLLSLGALQKRYEDKKLKRFFRWFKESRKNYKITSIRLFEKAIPDWIREGEPDPPPKFVPCGKCDNGYYLDKKRNTYVECACHAKWEVAKRAIK